MSGKNGQESDSDLCSDPVVRPASCSDAEARAAHRADLLHAGSTTPPDVRANAATDSGASRHAAQLHVRSVGLPLGVPRDNGAPLDIQALFRSLCPVRRRVHSRLLDAL